MATSSLSDFERRLYSLDGNINKILKFASETKCSDVFIKVGEAPAFYKQGFIYKANKIVDEIEWNEFARVAITSEQNAMYVREKMLDFSYEVGKWRYRVSAGYSQGKNTATFRMISERLPNFAGLGIDKETIGLLKKAFSARTGILLICGVTGSGKTTTLAACMNEFPNDVLKDANIITLEDPIEYTYPSKRQTRIMQKELGIDFASYEHGIKQALREHPSHIQIGETRDLPTINAMVQAAMTGHLCVSTFHTGSVPDTFSRLYSYLNNGNESVLYDLIANLNFIMCQKLIKGRKGYTLDYTYMFLDDQLKDLLAKAVMKGENLSTFVGKLMKNQQLLDRGSVKNFDYDSRGRKIKK